MVGCGWCVGAAATRNRSALVRRHVKGSGGFDGAAPLNRNDWGVTWNAPLEAGGVLLGEKVTLEFEISAIRNVDAA